MTQNLNGKMVKAADVFNLLAMLFAKHVDPTFTCKNVLDSVNTVYIDFNSYIRDDPNINDKLEKFAEAVEDFSYGNLKVHVWEKNKINNKLLIVMKISCNYEIIDMIVDVIDD